MMRKCSIALIIFTLIFATTVASFAGTELVKEYDFKAKSEKNLSYDAPKEIKEKGKTYKLKDVKYQAQKEISIVRSHTTQDQQDFPKTIEYETEDGQKVTLTAKGNIDWKETKRNPTVLTRTYSSRAAIPSSLPVAVTAGGKEVTGTAALTDTAVYTRTETFTAPGTFKGVEGSPYYSFNGKVVTLDGGQPTWSGYQADVAADLGLAGSGSITGASWAGAAVDIGGGEFTRQAAFTGSRPVSTFTATFTETDATTTSYTADITYSDSDGAVNAKAIATYEQASNLGLYIAIGVGVLILAILAAAILMFLSKKKKQQEDY